MERSKTNLCRRRIRRFWLSVNGIEEGSRSSPLWENSHVRTARGRRTATGVDSRCHPCRVRC
jgi:hypothetical protein